MKSTLTLSILIVLFTFNSYSQDRGCGPSIHESIIEARVFSADGTEKPDQTCLQFYQFQTYSNYINHNANEESTSEDWEIHIEPGDYLIINSKFASESSSASVADPYGFITVTSGYISNFEKSTYTASSGSCYAQGKNYVATIDGEIELVIDSPTYTPDLKIRVKVVEPPMEEITIHELPFISQVNNSDEIIITTNSELTEEIDVYTVSGTLIKRFSIEDGQRIQLAELPKGIYLITSEVNGNTLKGKYTRL